MKRVSIFLVAAALIAGMAGCPGDGYTPPSRNLEIRTWYDLDDVRDNLDGNHKLMNHLDSTTLGYTELASPTANGGKGWEPIGWQPIGGSYSFRGNFDGQGYEIHDLYINRAYETTNSYETVNIGLFSAVHKEGRIENFSVVDATVIGISCVGGLAGFNSEGTVSNSYFTGSVTGELRVGGLVGYSGGDVSNSYATGSVVGHVHVGGLVGWSIQRYVLNCYSTGTVTGRESVGGLVGQNDSNVSKCYSTGSVTGNVNVGGLVGQNYEGTVNNSFWDIETSGQATSDDGTGKNTTEMQDITTFSGAGWSIIEVVDPAIPNPAYIWNIVHNVTYPFLSWEP